MNPDRFFAPDLERDVCAALMSAAPNEVEDLLSILTAGDFGDPQIGTVFATVADLWAEGATRDPSMVAATSGLNRDWVFTAHAKGSPLGAVSKAARVADLASRRRLMVEVQGVFEQAHDMDAAELEASCRRILDASPQVESAPAVEASELAAMEFRHDWLVADLLERGDRLILTGKEGRGKSLLLRQMAVQFASGVHPFTRAPIRALRVLIVDLENSQAQLARSLRHLLVCAGDRYRGNLWVKARPQGMNLRSGADQRWLDGLMAHHRPDVMVLGPIYKAASTRGRESKNDETVAEETALALDRLRVKHGCALMLEAHSPHGDGRSDWRPYGASLWLRWPEFGFGLDPKPGSTDVIVKWWRGARERNRDWPALLAQGSSWPWVAAEQVEDE